MCGILGVHGLQQDQVAAYRPTVLAMTKSLRHRGPDWSGTWSCSDTILCHERLAICGVDSGAQPLTDVSGKLALCVNGEIYNHKNLRRSLKDPDGIFKTHSDCEVILHMYKEDSPEELCNKLSGMWAFILVDSSVTPSRIIVGRDPVGVTVLYQGWKQSSPGIVYFASELKALKDECDKIIAFPPGHFYDSKTGKTERYFKPTWWDADKIPSSIPDSALIRSTLEDAVKKRLMSEVPYGVLLSGGLDSSLIAAIAVRETEKIARAQYKQQQESVSASQSPNLAKIEEENDADLASWPQVHSFAIGLEGSPDLVAAKKAAKFLKTHHHEYTFTVQEGLDALADVVYHLETYDVTTLRASTPMYLLSRKIKAMGVKMVLSGEGSDEIFGGYLYFSRAPSHKDFHAECVNRVKCLHLADCLRANKSTMAWGLEARVPFLDKDFLEMALNIDPAYKTFGQGAHKQTDAEGRPKMEKYVLRKAFDCSPDGKPYLPDEILWRQKEQFSDGVGYSWIDGMKAFAETCVSDEDFASRKQRWTKDTPDTKEAYMIRELFEKHFPSKAAADTAMRWIPRTDWGLSSDPSGRAVKIHDAHISVG